MSDWTKYGLCVGVACLLCPPILGFVIGVGLFCSMWYVVYQLMGGNN